jgi:drug/metabolite transporter (DMT)-like permease
LSHPGEFAALLTAVFWTVTALAFEAASRKIGSMIVNLLRLLAGFTFLSIFVWIYRGLPLPFDASPHTWFYLILSGLVGFVFGDLCLFQAFVVIGARVSMLLMALSPPMTALISWIILGETMNPRSWLGMVLTISGIALVVLKRGTGELVNGLAGEQVSRETGEQVNGLAGEQGNGKKDGRGIGMRIRLHYPLWGILLGLGGAFGQALGLVLSKVGMEGYDTFASTQIRVIAGIVGFSILFFIFRRWKDTFFALRLRKPMLQLSLGAFFGPFLGVSFSLLAIKYADTGIAATIMALVPVLIIPPTMILYKEKVTLREILGAILAVGGVALFFL